MMDEFEENINVTEGRYGIVGGESKNKDGICSIGKMMSAMKVEE